ncbi:hypothetical protein CXG81DRAFT_23273 [Caulochytrium protostelioides]|uniref:EGF-like domain-containing protein n=1 Tax=Caulochytrium protostelioides TaxID=1555241 RepID=A0A4P9XF50_9FUNG|nr:hypothetical protein CXG81DRAFT_23273 [Caulochytrium protostelioides]|eukprot:RKP04168.1 hypothetical protein CXG81DRAFT_23273 [Caulochytrium protostelioides]
MDGVHVRRTPYCSARAPPASRGRRVSRTAAATASWLLLLLAVTAMGVVATVAAAGAAEAAQGMPFDPNALRAHLRGRPAAQSSSSRAAPTAAPPGEGLPWTAMARAYLDDSLRLTQAMLAQANALWTSGAGLSLVLRRSDAASAAPAAGVSAEDRAAHLKQAMAEYAAVRARRGSSIPLASADVAVGINVAPALASSRLQPRDGLVLDAAGLPQMNAKLEAASAPCNGVGRLINSLTYPVFNCSNTLVESAFISPERNPDCATCGLTDTACLQSCCTAIANPSNSTLCICPSDFTGPTCGIPITWSCDQQRLAPLPETQCTEPFQVWGGSASTDALRVPFANTGAAYSGRPGCTVYRPDDRVTFAVGLTCRSTQRLLRTAVNTTSDGFWNYHVLDGDRLAVSNAPRAFLVKFFDFCRPVASKYTVSAVPTAAQMMYNATRAAVQLTLDSATIPLNDPDTCIGVGNRLWWESRWNASYYDPWTPLAANVPLRGVLDYELTKTRGEVVSRKRLNTIKIVFIILGSIAGATLIAYALFRKGRNIAL